MRRSEPARDSGTYASEIEAPAVAYLTKPVNVRELRAVLERWITSDAAGPVG